PVRVRRRRIRQRPGRRVDRRQGAEQGVVARRHQERQGLADLIRRAGGDPGGEPRHGQGPGGFKDRLVRTERESRGGVDGGGGGGGGRGGGLGGCGRSPRGWPARRCPAGGR